jgi:hypothetical protein
MANLRQMCSQVLFPSIEEHHRVAFLFDIGIFDMVVFVIIGTLLNYADDSSSLISAPTNEHLFREARAAAGLMEAYCANNCLTLNGLKSVILCFRSSRVKQPIESPYVAINDLYNLFISQSQAYYTYDTTLKRYTLCLTKTSVYIK